MKADEDCKGQKVFCAQESEELEMVFKVSAKKLLIKAVVLKEMVIRDTEVSEGNKITCTPVPFLGNDMEKYWRKV